MHAENRATLLRSLSGVIYRRDFTLGGACEGLSAERLEVVLWSRLWCGALGAARWPRHGPGCGQGQGQAARHWARHDGPATGPARTCSTGCGARGTTRWSHHWAHATRWCTVDGVPDRFWRQVPRARTGTSKRAQHERTVLRLAAAGAGVATHTSGTGYVRAVRRLPRWASAHCSSAERCPGSGPIGVPGRAPLFIW